MPAHSRYGWSSDFTSSYRYAFHFATVPSEVRLCLGERPYLCVALREEDVAVIQSLSAELNDHFHKPNQYSHLYFERALLTLSLLILRDEQPRNNTPLHLLAEERVERAIAWYVEHMESNPTVEEVAYAMHMTSTHLRRMTRKARGRSPHTIFRELQLERALDLLANTSKTVEEIAHRCGFRSVEDFSRVFHRDLGTPASVWRNQYLSHVQGMQTGSGS
ncbi:helix-turn-helix transcriptional regulator [Ruficoccus amylovorans]|uniref:Helix-turn-helix transcriptional regulator n=1 Tax=Ruficoccus amylovorans TaxID=1804625 RepID=A0A842HKH5_9BACT|nr:AraC family transcriptional regulator [Ruficoccus amylovorans]MBC2595977.1 helix-turn-helix transcriptional regulator [Ruficoccus amylovorans]